MNARPIRFAIAGLGNIGQRHAKHILDHPQAQLVAVCDTNADVQKKLPEGIHFHTSLAPLLKETDADVVCICTPNYLHEPHTIMALEAGLHAVVEKPMALSIEECDRMIAAAEKTGNTIFAVKQNRYNPPVQVVKKLIEDNALGQIFMIQVNCFWNRGDAYYSQSPWRGSKEKDGGVLFTQFSHFIDILYYLNGAVSGIKGIVENYAHGHNTEFEDTGSFVMKAANGATINFNFTTCSFEKNMEGAITIFGEKGSLKIGGQYLNTIEYQQLESGKLPEINITAKANDYGLYQGSMSNHDRVIQNVIDVLQHNHPVMTSAQEGREVVKMICEMYAAAAK